MLRTFSRYSVAMTVAAFTCTGAVAQEAIELGVVSVNYNSPSIQRQTDAAVKHAESLGWTVEMFDGRGDQVATNQAAMGFIDRGFDAILNTASPNTQMSAVIEYANEKDVPFVSTFSGLVPGIVADIGSNNTADGVIAATELVGRMGSEGHIVKLNWTVLPALAERDRGFMAVLAGYPDIKVTEVELKVPGQVDDAYNQMTNLLLANDDINAVWTGWDEVAVPAARAISQAGRDGVIVSGLDGVPETIDMIREGSPIALTVAYDVDRMGTTAVEIIKNALAGETPTTRHLTLKPCLITQESAPASDQQIDFSTCTLFSGEDVKLQ